MDPTTCGPIGNRRETFADDVRRSKRVLEDAGGVLVRGYRAPTFSIGLRHILVQLSSHIRLVSLLCSTYSHSRILRRWAGSMSKVLLLEFNEICPPLLDEWMGRREAS